jgi:hypothetical protein
MPSFDISISDFPTQSSLDLTADIKYKSNWQQGALKVQRRNKWICAMKDALQELKIFGPGGDPNPPPEPVEPIQYVRTRSPLSSSSCPPRSPLLPFRNASADPAALFSFSSIRPKSPTSLNPPLPLVPVPTITPTPKPLSTPPSPSPTTKTPLKRPSTSAGPPLVPREHPNTRSSTSETSSTIPRAISSTSRAAMRVRWGTRRGRIRGRIHQAEGLRLGGAREGGGRDRGGMWMEGRSLRWSSRRVSRGTRGSPLDGSVCFLVSFISFLPA